MLCELVLDVLLLKLAQLLVAVGDLVEGLDDLRLELGLDGRERHLVLELVVLVHVGFGGGFARILLASPALPGAGAARNGVGDGGAAGGATCAGAAAVRDSGFAAFGGGFAVLAGRTADHRGVHAALGVGPGIGRFEIDDVAKEDLAFVELVAPDDDGLEGQRAFAEARDHRLAAGLDALGDRDFAFAGQQLDRAHLAQIHAHGIVGALARLALLDLGDGLLGDLDELVVGLVLAALVLVLLAFAIVGFGDVDAHVREHGHDVLDLLGRGLVGRQNFVELIEGHEAALLGLLDHLLHGRVGQIEQRRRRVLASPSPARPLPCRLFPCPSPAASLPWWPSIAPKRASCRRPIGPPA